MTTFQPQPEALLIAKIAARAADEKQATDITVLDVGEVLAITDLFVVASAGNKRQVRTICDAIQMRFALRPVGRHSQVKASRNSSGS